MAGKIWEDLDIGKFQEHMFIVEVGKRAQKKKNKCLKSELSYIKFIINVKSYRLTF